MQQEFDWKQAETVQEICLMAPTRQLAEKAKAIITGQGREDVDIFVASNGRRDIIECARTLARKGAKIIISRKGTQQIVEETTDLKVVGLNNTLTDYLRMLKNWGLHTPGLIAFFTYDPISEEVLEMCEMLDIQVKNYIFKTFEDCWDCVRAAMADGAVVGIGGAWTDPISKELGFPHITVENSEDTIVVALNMAEQIRRIQHEEAEKQAAIKTRMETYQAVLDFTHDAIMSIDDQCRVQVLNPVAERIMGCKASESIGKPVDQVLPNTMLPDVLRSGQKQTNQMMQIGKMLTNTNRIPIVVDHQIRGVVATFQDIKQLQSTEQKIRLKLHEKGLVAKYSFGDIVGESRAIRNTIQIARSYASSQAAVLIHGETGTGKELFAQSIHTVSDRRDGPFVAINCAAVSNNLLESELFGYEAGAFTGASKNGREGLFELAHGGTIFLDEIGEIPRETQVELLRVLQEKEVRRVGGNRVIPVDVRIITATNKDLIQETMEGRFREDLYYRLNVLDLELPPLRERGDDVRILGLQHFRRLCGGTATPEQERRYLDMLAQVQDYAWYGNIRELQNFTERVHILLQNDTEINSVMTEIMRRRTNGTPLERKWPGDEESQERKALIAALQNYPDSMEEAARSLGCSRQTLWRRMKKYGISRP